MPCAHFYVYIFTFLYEYCTLSQTVTYIIIFSIWIRETRFVGNDRKNEKTRFIVFFSTNIVKFDDIFFLFLVNFHTMMQCLTFTSLRQDVFVSWQNSFSCPTRYFPTKPKLLTFEHTWWTRIALDTINRTASWDHSNVCGGTIVRYKLLEIIRRSCFINDSSV